MKTNIAKSECEDNEDFEALRDVVVALEALVQGKKPNDWKSLKEFVAELND